MGLIKTGLKAAVAVKTAHYVHERIERRQQADWAAQGQQPTAAPGSRPPDAGQHPGYAVAPVSAATVSVASAPPGAEAPPTPGVAGQDRSAVLSQLKDLAELKAGGVLTEDEFLQQKALILGS